MRARIALEVLLTMLAVIATAEARQGTPGLGSWAQGFDHPTLNGPAAWPPTLTTFDAINMAVIPLTGTGTPSDPFGEVIVWDVRVT